MNKPANVSAPVPTPVPAGPALTLLQQRQALWADPRQTVYAVVMGERVRDLPQRLQAAAIDDWDRLWTGELEPAEVQAAPVLLALPRESAFTDWLLGQADADIGPWGLLLLSPRPFLAVRLHSRRLCEAVLPDGENLRLDWMDPEVLQALLPTVTPDTLQRLFSELSTLVLLDRQRWTWLSLSAGHLVQRTNPLQHERQDAKT